jgi:hypothetical protein
MLIVTNVQWGNFSSLAQLEFKKKKSSDNKQS